jgi:hypothetical protein
MLSSLGRFFCLKKLAPLSILILGACSSSSSPGASPGKSAADGGSVVDSGQVSCTADPRVDNYVAGLRKTGRAGALSFRLVSSDPAPPAKGSNTFVLQILDDTGARAPVSLSIDLKMPDHGHGTSVVPTVTFDSTTQSFSVTPLYLFMAGVWQIDFQAHATAFDAGTLVDSASFFFCIEG